MFYIGKKLSLLCFHLFLVLSYLLYQVFMFFKLHNTTNCFKFSESFAAFWTSKKFQQWSFQKNSRKIILKISTTGETRKVLGPARGGYQWPRWPAGTAQPLAAPTGRLGPTGPPSRYFFFPSLSLFPETRVLVLFLLFLLFLGAILRSLSTAHHLSWNFEQILPGMWLLHPSN